MERGDPPLRARPGLDREGYRRLVLEICCPEFCPDPLRELDGVERRGDGRTFVALSRGLARLPRFLRTPLGFIPFVRHVMTFALV